MEFIVVLAVFIVSAGYLYMTEPRQLDRRWGEWSHNNYIDHPIFWFFSMALFLVTAIASGIGLIAMILVSFG